MMMMMILCYIQGSYNYAFAKQAVVKN